MNDLPLEVWALIISHMEEALDLSSLMRTCKNLRDLTRSFARTIPRSPRRFCPASVFFLYPRLERIEPAIEINELSDLDILLHLPFLTDVHLVVHEDLFTHSNNKIPNFLATVNKFYQKRLRPPQLEISSTQTRGKGNVTQISLKRISSNRYRFGFKYDLLRLDDNIQDEFLTLLRLVDDRQIAWEIQLPHVKYSKFARRIFNILENTSYLKKISLRCFCMMPHIRPLFLKSTLEEFFYHPKHMNVHECGYIMSETATMISARETPFSLIAPCHVDDVDKLMARFPFLEAIGFRAMDEDDLGEVERVSRFLLKMSPRFEVHLFTEDANDFRELSREFGSRVKFILV